jgi:hypothetical protein
MINANTEKALAVKSVDNPFQYQNISADNDGARGISASVLMRMNL